jgi:uncharacterized alpha-E superfamily protein
VPPLRRDADATLDRSEAAAQVARIALAAVAIPDPAKGQAKNPYDAALPWPLAGSTTAPIYSSISRARENARQVRDQITTETGSG